MNNSQTKVSLQRLLTEAPPITVGSNKHHEFVRWRNLVLRTLEKIYGNKSTEYKQFSDLQFTYEPSSYFNGVDYSLDEKKQFESDHKIAIKLIVDLIHELDLFTEKETIQQSTQEQETSRKIFISHSFNDKDVVSQLIEILQTIGVTEDSIYCSSFSEYGTDLGQNFIDRIKNELSSNTLVIFLLSHNFYASPTCLCEMGASWALSRNHIPVLIPPFKFTDMKGVIPHSHGIYINDPFEINKLKEYIEKSLHVTSKLSQTSWERKRDNIISRITDQLKSKQ